MSTPKTGAVADVAAAARDVQQQLDARVEDLRQLELEDPISGEEMLAAREELGPVAGRLAVLARARENRGRGRPLGSRNKRTEDLARYLRQFGTDPLVGAMILQSEEPEVLAERWGCKITEVIDRQLRSRELIAPFMHSKMPVAIDATIRSDFKLIEEIVSASGRHAAAEDGEFVEIQADEGAGNA